MKTCETNRIACTTEDLYHITEHGGPKIGRPKELDIDCMVVLTLRSSFPWSNPKYNYQLGMLSLASNNVQNLMILCNCCLFILCLKPTWA